MNKTPIVLAVGILMLTPSITPTASSTANGQQYQGGPTWRPTRYFPQHQSAAQHPVTRSSYSQPCAGCDNGAGGSGVASPTYNGSAYKGSACSSSDSCGSSCGESCGTQFCDCGWGSSCCGSCEPMFSFSGQWLFLTRNVDLVTPNVIGGPETFGFNDIGFDYDSGYRLFGHVRWENWELAGGYTRLDNWFEQRAGRLNGGVAFDGGAAWAGANFVNSTTFFGALAAAASVDQAAGPSEANEAEGLGPTAVNAADFPPTFLMQYQSELDMMEVVLRRNDLSCWYKIGFGYGHVELDERALVSLRGLLRAVDVAGPNGGLSHAALIDPNGGNLQLLGGAADGFDDETGALGGAGPDRIELLHQATTTNRLNGTMFTFDAVFYDGPLFVFDGFVKSGIFSNHAQGLIVERYSGINNDNSVYGRTLFSEKDVVSYVGGVGLGGAVKLTENWLVQVGYEAIFIDGVALAPEQMRGYRGGVYEVVADGNVVAHGARVGMEVRY